MKRSPVVVILGHVDSGKTTILDFIRKTEIRHEEAGGITQSIGAYEIFHNGQRITFIDTPGHEAFSRMRSRGAQVADIAVLVVAGDRGVESQTKEAWQILQEAKIAVIVVINKIDKEGVDVNRVKAELAQNGILLEGYGGKVSWQAIAAKSGRGLPELLDLILLTAEVENLTYEPDHPASGIILESRLDSRRGPTAAVIIKDGVLQPGSRIATASVSGKVKSLENFLGERVKEIIPSSPALILGFENLPQIGEKFTTGDIGALGEMGIVKPTAVVQPGSAASQKLKLILKADTAGGLEALLGALGNYQIINQGVGEITDGDIKEAIAGQAVVVGYNVPVSKAALNLAKVHEIKIIESAVIYELVKLIEESQKTVQTPPVLGELEVLMIFGRKSGQEQIVGGRVLTGKIRQNINLEIRRGGSTVGVVKLLNLQQDKKDVAVVAAGSECGLLMVGEKDIETGDHLIYVSA